MAVLAKQPVDNDGLNPVYAAADALGDSFNGNSELAYVHVKNADVASRAVTLKAVVSQASFPGFGALDIADRVITVPASGEAIFQAPRSSYGQSPSWTYDDATNVTVAVVELERI